LSTSRCLDDESLSMFALNSLRHSLDGFQLIEAINYGSIHLGVRQRFLGSPLVDQIAKAIFGVVTEYCARWISLNVIPEPSLKAVRVEDDGALGEPLFECISIEGCLLTPLLCAFG